MRIGIDCRTILNPESGERAGIGHYTYQLVKALLKIDHDNHYVLFFDHRMAFEGTQEFEQANVTIKFFPFSAYGKFLPIGYSQLLIAAALQRAKLDLFHAPANVIPLGYRRPSIVTIHDLAIFRHPEWFPRQPLATSILVPRSVKRAKQIIAVSESTKRDLVNIFSLPEAKITVVPEAADVGLLPLEDAEDNVREVYDLPERFAFFVGTVEPRKNLEVLCQAWQRLHQANELDGAELIIAGGAGYKGETLLKEIQSKKWPGVRAIGYVPHNHKIKLIQEAAVMAFPSLYEGFGLPVLEAMTLGTPVVTANTSSLSEVAGNAALMVDPSDVLGLAEELRHVLTDPQLAAKLGEEGQKQATKFSWILTAEKTLGVYRKVGPKA